MKNNMLENTANRRGFLKFLGGTAAAIGLGSISSKLQGSPMPDEAEGAMAPADAWFKKGVKGKHRIVFDCTGPNDILPFAWPKIFQLTNAATGTPEAMTTAIVVLRHTAICYAFDHPIWEKYNFGEFFHAMQPMENKEPAKKNPFWMPPKGAFVVPGIGEVEIGINQLMASGVMFCVCNAAMTVMSAIAADKMKMKAEDVKKEWEAGLIPGIQVVPSGVWAVGRAQEYDCAYCFAGA